MEDKEQGRDKQLGGKEQCGWGIRNRMGGWVGDNEQGGWDNEQGGWVGLRYRVGGWGIMNKVGGIMNRVGGWG